MRFIQRYDQQRFLNFTYSLGLLF